MILIILETLSSLLTMFSWVIIFAMLLTYAPSLMQYSVVRSIYMAGSALVDPFRGIIPPIGGAIDLSPVLALLAIRLLRYALYATLTPLL